VNEKKGKTQQDRRSRNYIQPGARNYSVMAELTARAAHLRVTPSTYKPQTEIPQQRSLPPPAKRDYG
jgi:hypothetical protein